MSLDQWGEIEEIFTRGLDASEAEREQLLRTVSTTIAETVRQLWLDSAQAPDFLVARLPASVSERHAPGDHVEGRFRLTAFLGAGGMGEVFSATDDVLGRAVSLKFLNPSLALRTASMGLLEREARAVCSLTHPNICTLYDLRWDAGKPFLVMEYLAGETLAERIRRGPISVEDSLVIAIGIVDGLSHAHGKGVVHRDLKPANVMLTPLGPKIFDFGIAKRVESMPLPEAGLLTSMGSFIGSISYMSPEQAEEKPVDARSDIFSLGCLLYEMTTGCRAFEGSTALSTLAAVLRSEPRPIRDIRPDIPAELSLLLAKCLEKDPSNRFQNATEVQRALDRLEATRSAARLLSRRTPATGARALIRTNRFRRSTIGLMLAIAGGVVAFSLSNDRWLSRNIGDRKDAAPIHATTGADVELPAATRPAGNGADHAAASVDRFRDMEAASAAAVPVPSAAPISSRPVRSLPATGPQAPADAPPQKVGPRAAPEDSADVTKQVPAPLPSGVQPSQEAPVTTLQSRPDVGGSDERTSEMDRSKQGSSPDSTEHGWNASADIAQIRQLLSNLSAAFTNRSIPAVVAIWPTLTEGERRRLHESFANSKAVTCDFVLESEPEFGSPPPGTNRPDTATLRVRRIVRMIPYFGAPPPANDENVTLHLERSGTGWTVHGVS